MIVLTRTTWGDTIMKSKNVIAERKTVEALAPAFVREKERMRSLGWAIADTVGIRKHGNGNKDYCVYEMEEK